VKSENPINSERKREKNKKERTNRELKDKSEISLKEESC
jgi:hypothetical protein